MAKAIANWDADHPVLTDTGDQIQAQVGPDGNFGAIEVGMLQEHSQAQALITDWKHRRGLCAVLYVGTAAQLAALADVGGALGLDTDTTPDSFMLNNGGGWLQVPCQAQVDAVEGTDVQTENTGGWALIPDLTTAFTPDADGELHVELDIPLRLDDSDSIGYVELNIGGVSQIYTTIGPVSKQATFHVHLRTVYACTSGVAVTVKAQWAAAAAAHTISHQGSATHKRLLTAIMYRGV